MQIESAQRMAGTWQPVPPHSMLGGQSFDNRRRLRVRHVLLFIVRTVLLVIIWAARIVGALAWVIWQAFRIVVLFVVAVARLSRY